MPLQNAWKFNLSNNIIKTGLNKMISCLCKTYVSAVRMLSYCFHCFANGDCIVSEQAFMPIQKILTIFWTRMPYDDKPQSIFSKFLMHGFCRGSSKNTDKVIPMRVSMLVPIKPAR